MSTYEDIRDDARRDAAEARYQAIRPDDCPECAKKPMAVMLRGKIVARFETEDEAADYIAAEYLGVLGYTVVEVEQRWRLIGTDPAYGADADGRRGAMLREWECDCCGNVLEVLN